jgi:hypothetical protein
MPAEPSTLFPTKYLPRPQVADLPVPPLNQWRFVGPGIGVLAVLTLVQQIGKVVGG